MNILPFYAALLGLLFFYLSIRTIRLRRRLHIGVGAKENDEMLRGMRVHSNFAEYVPLTLILIYFVEIQGAHPWLVHTLGLTLLAGRVVHAYGMSQMNEKFIFRVSGMAMTFTTLLTACAFLMFRFLIHHGQ